MKKSDSNLNLDDFIDYSMETLSITVFSQYGGRETGINTLSVRTNGTIVIGSDFQKTNTLYLKGGLRIEPHQVESIEIIDCMDCILPVRVEKLHTRKLIIRLVKRQKPVLLNSRIYRYLYHFTDSCAKFEQALEERLLSIPDM